MLPNYFVPLTAFALTCGVVFLVLYLVGSRKNRRDARLEELLRKAETAPPPAAGGNLVRTTLATLGTSLVPIGAGHRSRLEARLIHAGVYGPHARLVFLGVKLLLMVLPLVLGSVLSFVGLIPLRYGLYCGAILSVLGIVGPSFWLLRKKARRQASLRRSLPDFLDVLVVCLEGGLSLPAAFSRVTDELQSAYPLLATELRIVQREVQLGVALDLALRHFGDRADLEEIHSLATVIGQTERFGGGVAKALRIYAEEFRDERLLNAEEMAVQAATKIVFPTLLFIFPGIFVIILGPAIIQIMQLLERMKVPGR